MNTRLMRLMATVRYREISRAMSKMISISSLASLKQELTVAISGFVPECGLLDISENDIIGPFAKYSILDLTFDTGRSTLSSSDKVTWRMFKELGFLGGKREARGARHENGDLTCLTELIEQISAEKEWLRVYLRLEPHGKHLLDFFNAVMSEVKAGVPYDDAVSLVLDRGMEKLHTRFPANFRIQDVCVTNATSVWLHKHFYL